jgi:hypothetical protein
MIPQLQPGSLAVPEILMLSAQVRTRISAKFCSGRFFFAIGLDTHHATPHRDAKLHPMRAEGVAVQGKFTHRFKGAAPETGGPGSAWSQPARQVHDDKCEEGADCIVVVYFQGKLDFMRVNMKAH